MTAVAPLIDTVSSQCVEKELICEETDQKVTELNKPNSAKARMVLSEVKSNKSNSRNFLEVLNEHLTCQGLAKELEEELDILTERSQKDQASGASSIVKETRTIKRSHHEPSSSCKQVILNSRRVQESQYTHHPSRETRTVDTFPAEESPHSPNDLQDREYHHITHHSSRCARPEHQEPVKQDSHEKVELASPETEKQVSPDQASPETKEQLSEEERVFGLLFGQCDTEGVGLVDTKKLMGYIRNMQLQYRRPEGEELFESHDSVSYYCNGFILSLLATAYPSTENESIAPLYQLH